MECETRNGEPGPRAHRVGARLGDGTRLRQGENPARWRGHLENLLPKKSKVRRVKHHAALPYGESRPSFATRARRMDRGPGAGVRYPDAARTGEVIGATWAEMT